MLRLHVLRLSVLRLRVLTALTLLTEYEVRRCYTSEMLLLNISEP